MSESGTGSDVSRFVAAELAARKKQVATTRNSAGYAAIYPEIARLAIEKYPKLTGEERSMVSSTLKRDAASLGRDTTMALRAVARILGS